MDFTETVKKCMEIKKVNTTSLARMTGYSVQYMADLLAGNRRWNEDTMAKVCRVLGIKMIFISDDLKRGKENTPTQCLQV